MAEQSIKIDENEPSRNLFIVFYTIRQLWKLSGHKMDDLYKTLFPSKSATGGNKTLYDNILRLKSDKLFIHSKRLADITGISEKYFTGECMLPVSGLVEKDWIDFVRLRKTKGANLNQIEHTIKKAIRETKKNPEKQSDPFKKLVYFAEYGRKKADKPLEDLIWEIEKKISEVTPSVFEKADSELLKKHEEVIREYLRRVDATIILKMWRPMA